VSPDDDTGPLSGGPPAQVGTRRWLLRLGVVAIGLWFVVDGLRGSWPAAGVVARGLLVLAVVLGVALLVVCVLPLVRRDRDDRSSGGS
jgi:hypothetical protein